MPQSRGVGKAIAAQWLVLRTGDGLEAAIVYTPAHGPGIWEPVPTYPAPPPNAPPPPVGVWMTQFKPFAMRSADQFLADVHPLLALTGAAWAWNFNLTKDYGALNSAVRTPQQTVVLTISSCIDVSHPPGSIPDPPKVSR